MCILIRRNRKPKTQIEKETTMKNVTTSTLILAAAALTFSVTTAFAQSTTQLKAEVPFSFSIGSAQYPAGTYQTEMIANTSGARVMKIVNRETGAPRIVVAITSAYPRNEAEKESGARLVFRCADSGCALVQIWPGNQANGLQLATPSAKRGEPTHLAVIRLQPTAAD
jgi:hypothetical protein